MSNQLLKDAPFREVNFAPVDISVEKSDDGVIKLNPNEPLRIEEPHMPAYLRRHAAKRPEKVWLSKRAPGGGDWVGINFGDARKRVDSLTQALLDLNLPENAKMVVLSGNCIENALIGLAAMQARVVFAPISIAYALQSTDHIKLKEVVSIVEPDLIFVEHGAKFSKAIAALDLGVPVIAAKEAQAGQLSFDELIDTEVTPAVDASFDAIQPNDVAKLMFTSGSTGTPKGVPQTHRAILVAVISNLQTMGELDHEESLLRLDWAPWSHVMGATGLYLAIANGGCSYIDDGRPAPKLFDETIRNLKEVGVTCFVTLPAAYNMLVEALEQDEEFAAQFFKNLQSVGYGGAALPGAIVDRIQTLAVKHVGCKIPVTCGYGATETGPSGAFIYWPTDITGLIGLPHPGADMKLVPFDEDRYEVRISGEGVMEHYHRRPDLNADIFDEEGYYKIGDTVRLADPNDPLKGLAFAGRISEEFKMQNGTFVLVGSLRLAILKAASPLLMEVVICGETQLYLGATAWLNLDAARNFTGRSDATLAELNQDPKILEAIEQRFKAYNDANPGQSRSIKRLKLLDTPPSIDDGEMTDKGSVNQRKSQQLRADVVASLFADELAEGVLDFS
jgi:feruloyl-CoA synthase